MAPGKVTVFGGTGFLGQRVVQRLLERDFSVRVAVRHPERIAALFPALHLNAIQADVNDDRSVAAAVADVEGVVNAVSLYAESGPQTFHSVHVEAATRVARLARDRGVVAWRLRARIGTGAGLSPILDPLHRRLQPFRYLHDCSGCFRLERSPGGACTHWKAPPCHGAHVKRTLRIEVWMSRSGGKGTAIFPRLLRIAVLHRVVDVRPLSALSRRPPPSAKRWISATRRAIP